jgi:hypothetical protein
VGERDAGLLLETDVLWLDEKEYDWTVTPDGVGGGYLIIRDYPLAKGRFDCEKTDLMLRIPKGYNDSALDMWWVYPAIRLVSTGTHPSAADHFEDHAGRKWQRFSRHLQSPWRAGIDDIPRYMKLVARELQGTT